MGKSSIDAVEEKLPPGFRFYPRDEELICDYLMNKIVMTFDDDATCTNNTNSALLAVPRLVEVDLNKSEPWDIPACVGGKQWYFYSRRDKKYATGLRTNRATATGYWKATGKDRGIYSNSSRRGAPLLVGMRKTLVFYQGRAPKGRKSDWVMHEFRLEGSPSPPLPPLKFCSSAKEDWVLCRVFHKDKEEASSGSKQVSGGSSDRIRHDDHYGIQLQTSTASSSLPPLMDDPYISFIHTQTSSSNNNAMMNHQNHLSNNNHSNSSNLHVPCFSIFSQNQTMSYCYPTIVPASVNVPDQQTCTGNSGAFDGVIKQDSISQQNRALFNTNMKVVFNQVTTTSNDPAPSDKLKSKISSSCDDFGDGNNSPDRDSYLPESMWRHQQY